MPALRRREPGFAGLAHIVCGQQLSTASAAAIWGRLSKAFDPFDHDAVRRARADRLGRLGLSAAKIKTLKFLAREIVAERVNLDVLAEEDADAAHHTLTALHGIGPWTADVYLLFCLGHGDAWPAGDLAVQEGVKIGLGLKDAADRETDGAARGTLAAAARRGRASVVELLSRDQEARGRDRGEANVVSNFVAVAKRRGPDKDRGIERAGINMQATDFVVASVICSNARRSPRNCPTRCRGIIAGEGRSLRLHRQQHHLRGARRRTEILAAVSGANGFGNIPVWGFGEVIASTHPKVPKASACSAISRWRRIS